MLQIEDLHAKQYHQIVSTQSASSTNNTVIIIKIKTKFSIYIYDHLIFSFYILLKKKKNLLIYWKLSEAIFFYKKEIEQAKVKLSTDIKV